MTDRTWIIYLAQDKHLDYNWCGSTPAIEARMALLLDYYLERAEAGATSWNLDGTRWLAVYRRQRGAAAAERLLHAIRQRRIGYAANAAVMLLGLQPLELALRAFYAARLIEQATGVSADLALAMENVALPGGFANVLSACGVTFLARGIYPLRAESYYALRQPFPLFWWRAPDGTRILVRWDLYEDTSRWGGYAEAFALAQAAGETWDALQVRSVGDRNTDAVYAQRVAYIHATVARYAAYGERYPISSILLLGTGWDNWTCTEDFAAFIRRFNADPQAHAGRIRLVDARYQDFFHAALEEITAHKLELPVLEGTFGICWEEWAAHLAGPTAAFREAERLLRRAEAAQALVPQPDPRAQAALRVAWDALLDFTEHDFGGVDRATAALSAGVRAGSAAVARAVAHPLAPPMPADAGWESPGEPCDAPAFAWRGGEVIFDPHRCAIASLVDADGYCWTAPGAPALGEFIHTLYPSGPTPDAVFPPGELPTAANRTYRVELSRHPAGIQLRTEGTRWGFGFRTLWRFHAAAPWIDVTYTLEDGWTESPQAVRFCFPLALAEPTYRYDSPGAVQVAGPRTAGGDDLPGANPVLYAAQTFAAAFDARRGAILLAPDTLLVGFGLAGVPGGGTAPAIVAVPMMNLTRNDWQLDQGGERHWCFRYRLILAQGAYDALQPFREAQRFGVPAWLHVPGAPPVLPDLEPLDLRFDGGPLVALKLAEDGTRLILRLWNVLDRPVEGSLRLFPPYISAQRCDALERPLGELALVSDRAYFTVSPRAIATLALLPATNSRQLA